VEVAKLKELKAQLREDDTQDGSKKFVLKCPKVCYENTFIDKQQCLDQYIYIRF